MRFQSLTTANKFPSHITEQNALFFTLSELCLYLPDLAPLRQSFPMASIGFALFIVSTLNIVHYSIPLRPYPTTSSAFGIYLKLEDLTQTMDFFTYFINQDPSTSEMVTILPIPSTVSTSYLHFPPINRAMPLSYYRNRC